MRSESGGESERDKPSFFPTQPGTREVPGKMKKKLKEMVRTGVMHQDPKPGAGNTSVPTVHVNPFIDK
jgi:hypothetical protein